MVQEPICLSTLRVYRDMIYLYRYLDIVKPNGSAFTSHCGLNDDLLYGQPLSA